MSKTVPVKRLVTDEERAQLLANGGARALGQGIDPVPVVKLFTPDAHAAWLLTELDPGDGDTAYGLCAISVCVCRRSGPYGSLIWKGSEDPGICRYNATCILRRDSRSPIHPTGTGRWFD